MAAQPVGMNNLTTLIKRLEAATSRLEDIASSAFDHNATASTLAPASGVGIKTNSAPELPVLAESTSQTTPKAAPATPLPPALADMDTLIDTEVKAFVDASSGLDPLVTKQAGIVAKGFADQRKFLLITTKAKRPDPSSQTFMDLLHDLQHDLTAAGDIRESNRGSPMKEHLALVAEGISTLQWLVMDGKPADVVADMIGGAEMYGNRVLKTYKEGDQAHVKFVRSYYALLRALQAYITKHYRSGVTWNANGVDAAQALRDVNSTPSVQSAPSLPPPAAGAPPPPPPPLPNFDNVPPPPPPPPGGAPKAAGGDMGAVFEQLNRGSDVTSGLRKVDKSQMTHKNPSLRAGSTVPDREDISRSKSPGPQIKPKPTSMRQASAANLKKEGKTELDGNKWLIENYDSPSSHIEIEVSQTQSILISRCKNTTIVLRGKANALSIDNSPRAQIVVDTLISSIDVIKSPNFALQIDGSAPTVLLDQVDGATIYLGKESLATEVFTSKCSSVNVILPPETEQGDSTELPLPEQIRTVVKNGKLVSEIVEHAG